MPEVTHHAAVRAPLADVWAHVRDIDNWAPFVMGYRSHEVVDERLSVWEVRGDVGPLARTVHIEVEVTEWRDEERVSFVLRGRDEQLTGSGSFTIASRSEAAPPPTVARAGLGARLRALLGRLLGRRRAAPAPPPTTGTGPDVGLAFALSIQAGGMAGPVVNALVQPLLEVAADDLATALVRQIEGGLATPETGPSR